MRVAAKWTPSGIALWLIAALVATVAVCFETRSVTDDQPSDNEVAFDVEQGSN